MKNYRSGMKRSMKGAVPFNHLLSVFSAIIIVGLTFSVGYYLGTHQQAEIEKVEALKNKTQDTETVDFSSFWRAWNVIDEKYVPAAEADPASTSTESDDVITDQDKVWGSIQGLARSLEDPYTVFLPPQDSKTFEEDISGNFEGVGMEIGMRDGVLTVVAPLEGTPAQQAGIQSQDKIIEIDGKSTQNMTVDEAVQNIRGEGGSTVTFTIIREGVDQPLTIPVVRDSIEIPVISTTHRPDGIFTVKLHNFSQRSPYQFRQAMREFIRSGSDKLILDLRQNPGGYLSAAVDMASYFLPEGDVVVREDFGTKRKEQVYRSTGHTINTSGLGMVILVDGGSASASEILAGALSEHGVATLVGSQTFGKGSVQELVKITDNPKTSLKVTVARWLTPNGTSISKGGLTPKISVERTAEQYRSGIDPQLDRAVELLLSE